MTTKRIMSDWKPDNDLGEWRFGVRIEHKQEAPGFDCWRCAVQLPNGDTAPVAQSRYRADIGEAYWAVVHAFRAIGNVFQSVGHSGYTSESPTAHWLSALKRA